MFRSSRSRHAVKRRSLALSHKGKRQEKDLAERQSRCGAALKKHVKRHPEESEASRDMPTDEELRQDLAVEEELFEWEETFGTSREVFLAFF